MRASTWVLSLALLVAGYAASLAAQRGGQSAAILESWQRLLPGSGDPSHASDTLSVNPVFQAPAQKQDVAAANRPSRTDQARSDSDLPANGTGSPRLGGSAQAWPVRIAPTAGTEDQPQPESLSGALLTIGGTVLAGLALLLHLSLRRRC